MRALSLFTAAALLALTTGCSSGSGHPSTQEPTSIGQVVARSSPSAAASSAPLGSAITQGALTITVAGPVATKHAEASTLVTFHVTMANTSTTGGVIGPNWFGVRCDQNRSDSRPGDMMSTSTITGDKNIGAGQTVTGTVVEAWLTWDSTAKCTGVTTIEARFDRGGFLSWILPDDVVATVNTAGNAG